MYTCAYPAEGEDRFAKWKAAVSRSMHWETAWKSESKENLLLLILSLVFSLSSEYLIEV